MYMTRHKCKRSDANVENADPDTELVSNACVHEPECTVSSQSHIMSGIVSVVGCCACIQRSMIPWCRVV